GRDCNTNATPDVCELAGHDCNTNDTLDVCDTIGGAGDCDTNRVPDVCELAQSVVVDWTQRSPAVSPPARDFHAMTYDSARGVTVLSGGSAGGGNDTWVWNGATWTQRLPATSPPGRYLHAMAYDSGRGVTVLFGGATTDDTVLGDTWEWNGTNW